MKIENSNQWLKYLKELELLRKNHDKELSKLQSRKEAYADVATKRYVDLLWGKFGMSRKDWKKAMEEWEKKMDANSDEEDSSSTSPDTEGGTKKSEKERKGSYEEYGCASYPSLLGTTSFFPSGQESFYGTKIFLPDKKKSELTGPLPNTGWTMEPRW